MRDADTDKLWDDRIESHRTTLRYLRYEEFITQAQSSNKFPYNAFWTDSDVIQSYTVGGYNTLEALAKAEEHLEGATLKQDDTLTDSQIMSMSIGFTTGFWNYVHSDQIHMGLASGTTVVEQPAHIKQRMPKDMNMVEMEVSEEVILDQCDELRERYRSLQRPLGGHYVARQQLEIAKKGISNNKKKKNRRKKASQQQHKPTEQSHEESMKLHLTKLLNTLIDIQSPTLAYGRLLFAMMQVLIQGACFDKAIRSCILVPHDGSEDATLFDSLLQLQNSLLAYAKQADRDLKRSPQAAYILWNAYASLMYFLGVTIGYHASVDNGATEDEVGVASFYFKKYSAELLQHTKKEDSTDNDIWYTEETSVWRFILEPLRSLPKKHTVDFIKNHWDLMESTCLRNLDEDDVLGSFENDRIKSREVGMARQTSHAVAKMVNNLCNLGMEPNPTGMGSLPGKVCHKLLNKGAVPLLLQLARSPHPEISGEAMNGLSQISRMKDCRDILHQQLSDTLDLIQESLQSDHALRASGTMLLALHLVWDVEWRDPLRDLQPGLEEMCMKWAAFSMHSILEQAQETRREHSEALEEKSKDYIKAAKLEKEDQDLYFSNLKEQSEKRIHWTDLERKDQGIYSFTISRCLLLLCSGLLARDDMPKRLESTNSLFSLLGACVDIPTEDARNGIAALLNNYIGVASGGPPSPDKFPDAQHFLDGLFYQMEELMKDGESPKQCESTLVMCIVQLYHSEEWKPIFTDYTKTNLQAKYMTEYIAERFGRPPVRERPPAPRRDIHPPQNDLHERLRASGGTLAKCAACGKLEGKRGQWKKCGGCGLVHYCSRDCQKLDWKAIHKYECQKAV